MSPKRFLPILVLALAAAGAVVSLASAGGIRDWEPCPLDANGVDLICPDGQVGVPYSIKFRAVEEPPCQLGDDFWYVKSGAAPTGLSLASDGTLSGTPTESGTWGFWVEMKLPDTPTCNGTADSSQERFVIAIHPGIPKLTIGPEAAPVGTVGTSYVLAMTATLADPKTWSIASGTLPPGLAIDASTGRISGTPTTPGSYPFTVQAVIDAQRTDTKALNIVVRTPLAIAASDDAPLSEVGVRFQLALTPSGGSQVYTWALTGGDLPPGLTFLNGAITGRPTLPGDYGFIITLTDNENRTATYPGELTVEPRLAIPRQRLKTGMVRKNFRTTLRSLGGAGEALWRVKQGPLPRGIRFDRTTGAFYGVPTKAGTWRIKVEIVDELGVKATATVVLIVKPALLRRTK